MAEILREPATEHLCRSELEELSVPAQTVVRCSCGQRWIYVKKKHLPPRWLHWDFIDELVYVLTGKVPNSYRD